MSANSTLLDRIIFHPTLCEGWKHSMEGAAYHLAGCILLLGYMGGSGTFGSIYIFGFLVVGFLCYAVWGWLNACGLDIFTWNMLLVLICLLQLAHLVYQLRKDTFAEEFDLLYKQVCQPLQVPLQVYKEIVKCCEEQVVPLMNDETYAVEGKTSIDRLSFLLSGRIRVSQDGQFLHYIFPYQFLDSPEWESLRPSEEGTFQVTLTAETDCSFITWPRKKLYLLLAKERYIARLFSVLLGYDISEKLYAVNEKLFAKFGLRFDIRLPSIYHVLGPASSDTEVEKEPGECEEPPVSLSHSPAFVQTAPVAPCPVPLPAPPRKPRPDSDLSASGSLLKTSRLALTKGRAPLAPTQTPEL
ncbi:popeye domain-containing protein 2 isoform X2 [Hemicordylus capensis]|uniref:popeye domain-containing protein 2 isoform X2 n=1 Tax=Hemicordylus capensis TaxID=884348 RepID=UPI0023024E31|nr:popeye domain-containing protein 2 isoform X2 [Hemicordylus capensis]XP_053151866.1 popeye domain-containing protein 2 isoform X2 [Hemicordylus capensis]XP_053151867.1 popeye domain-containing protein 2 isoform X2 [Hemicordylus capensis]